MNDDDFLARALDHELTPDEERTLADRLKAEPGLARRLVELSRDEALLADGIAEARAGRSLEAPSAGAARPSRLLAFGALVAGVALAICFLPRSDPAAALLLDFRGDVTLDGRPAERGQSGRILVTGPEGRATMQTREGSIVVVSAGTSLEFESEGRGRLASGQLEVLEGRLLLRQGNDRVDVPAGRLATAAPGQPIVVESTTVPVPPVAPDFGSGRGLRAEYFDNENLTHLKVVRIDPTVDFNWGLSGPHSSIDPEYFSVRWRGQVEPLYSETYEFHVISDDGARLWIDGKPVVDDWTVRGTRERTGTIDLVAGRRYDLRLEYLQAVSLARVTLLWSSASQKREVVPARQLYPAPSENHLIDETFSSGRLTPDVWDARLEGARFEPGYLHFPIAEPSKAASLTSLRAYDRKPGLCLAAVYLGNVHRGGLKDESPTVQFTSAVRPEDRAHAGPGWTMGQHHGRFLNTAVPLVEQDGLRNYPIRNDNIDTLFLTVLREKGAFYLTCGEPASTPPRARLWHVSHTGETPAYRVAISGGRANARFASLTLTDLGGPWAEPYGIATRVEKEPATGAWIDSTADGQWEVTVTPAAGAKAVGLIVRAKDDANHYRFEFTPNGSRLIRRANGVDTEIQGTGWREKKMEAGKACRLSVRMEDRFVNLFIDDAAATYGRDLPAVEPIGTKVGFRAQGEATFRDYVAWPTTVEIPETLAAKIPPVHLHADNDLVVHDDFQAPDGTPLQGRMPKLGRRPWTVGQGEWTIERGAAMLKKAPGYVRLDCGVSDYEISAAIELPPMPPPPGRDWFPAILARSSGAGRLDAVGGISARFLWQGGSNEIEVWDRPAFTPANEKKWAASDGPNAGRMLTELINATNITPMLHNGRTHALRIVVRGSRVSYFCDEILVGTADTRVPHGPWVGLGIDEGGDAGIRFLDFSVRAFRH